MQDVLPALIDDDDRPATPTRQQTATKITNSTTAEDLLVAPIVVSKGWTAGERKKAGGPCQTLKSLPLFSGMSRQARLAALADSSCAHRQLNPGIRVMAQGCWPGQELVVAQPGSSDGELHTFECERAPKPRRQFGFHPIGQPFACAWPQRRAPHNCRH
jgi:hypothetical protein